MVFKIGTLDTLKGDIDNKTIANGLVLSGSVKGDKISLHLEDEHGKYSKFATRTFYGRFSDGQLVGSFRINNYVLVWMIILAALAVENFVTSVIFQGASGVAVSVGIIIVEIIYLVLIKKLSFEHDLILKEYLNTLSLMKKGE